MGSEFESTWENEGLKEAIIARIQKHGGISFRDFMAMALYEPRLGYYCSGRETMGRQGDYLTSPEVSPLFGVMIGRQTREMWQIMGRPSRFDVIEVGAGNGSLCRDLLGWANRTAPDLFDAIRCVIVEPIPALELRQRNVIERESPDAKVCWLGEMPDGIYGCILSNELLDSMPVHRVTVREGTLRELFVTSDGNRFLEELREPSTPEIERYFERLGLLPAEGCRAEVNLEALHWMQEAAKALDRGVVLTFDYGYEAAELYAPWRRDGTLLCFYRHNPSNNTYVRIGRQDMTSHVDFTSIKRAGEEAGMETAGFISQADFLMNMRVGEALPPGGGELVLEERLARRRAVSELVDPAGLGRIKVLAQAKGVEDAPRGHAGLLLGGFRSE